MSDIEPKKKRVFGLPQKREEVIALLNTCYSKNLLELEEFENRIELAEKAKSIDELEEILSDIPEDLKKPVQEISAPAVKFSESEDIRCIFSSKDLSVLKLSTKKMNIKARFGSITMNYYKTGLPEGIIDVNIDSILSTFYITIPPDARVETDLQEIFSNSYEGISLAKAVNPPRTIIRLKGKAILSSVYIEVKTAWFSNLIAKVITGFAEKIKLKKPSSSNIKDKK